MTLALNGTTATDVYLNGTKIDKAYLDGVEVYSSVTHQLTVGVFTATIRGFQSPTGALSPTSVGSKTIYSIYAVDTGGQCGIYASGSPTGSGTFRVSCAVGTFDFAFSSGDLYLTDSSVLRSYIYDNAGNMLPLTITFF